MKFNKLFKRSVTGKILEYTIEVENNKFRTHSGHTDGVISTSDWTICESKSYCTSDEQALKEANSMFNKCKELSYFENIKDVDKITFFKPMLACKIEDYLDDLKYPIYSQPKLDGIRCIVKLDGMWSRNGKKIISAPHIYKALKPLFEQNPDLVFDGELYADKFSNDFNAICSLVKKTKPNFIDLQESAEKIEYHIYDIPSNTGIFSDRYNELIHIELPKCCIKVNTYTIFEPEEIDVYFDGYIEDKYEGQMIRLDTKYENKRSKNLLKHKSFIDDEFTILDVKEGKGKLMGKAGTFVFNGFESPINGDHEYLEKLWNDRNNLIGKTATVKYFNLTPDDKPRFPKVINIDRNW
jgi:ATP-dependent DNA ligase